MRRASNHAVGKEGELPHLLLLPSIFHRYELPFCMNLYHNYTREHRRTEDHLQFYVGLSLS